VIGPRPEIAGFSGGVGAGYPTMLDELQKLGFSEGRNLAVEYRSIEQEPRAVFADAAELAAGTPMCSSPLDPKLV
jgi:hypothetical protein